MADGFLLKKAPSFNSCCNEATFLTNRVHLFQFTINSYSSFRPIAGRFIKKLFTGDMILLVEWSVVENRSDVTLFAGIKLQKQLRQKMLSKDLQIQCIEMFIKGKGLIPTEAIHEEIQWFFKYTI